MNQNRGFRKPGVATPDVDEWAKQADSQPADPVAQPWRNADPTRMQQFLARMPAPLHAKLTWLKANLPGGPSIQQQVLGAAEEWADKMIAQLEAERERRRNDKH
jgi:hypothetical protein